ncbi:MAG: DUF58 domain-containing protein [Myxococcales bacterium]|nr:DUF58 domain-containing protein [Myxococcota bacterium]MDW8281974.1 DUF58 domain-containing protein [Myxococcales bacterium]
MASAASRLPTLSPRGQTWLALAVVLLLLGAGGGSLMLSACGLAALAALLALYLRFIPVAVLLWRRYLEVLLWVEQPSGADGSPRGILVHRPFVLRLVLRNLAPLPLGCAQVRPLHSSALASVRAPPPLLLPPRCQVCAEQELVAMQAGTWFIHGAAVQLRDTAGLMELDAYFPLPTPIQVLPRRGGRATLLSERIALGAPDERLGAHALRHRGLGGELRELREYAPGDPFKLIAWKASARAPYGRLLVRDLDRETLVCHYLILDIGASMRQGRPGTWKLDHALELCLSYARAALEGGDSVGLITFDGAVFSHTRPAGGPAQRVRLTKRLLEVMHVVDERFCGVDDAELCARVARYLRQQEGLDVCLPRPPSIDDVRAWSRVQVAPGAEVVFDLERLIGAARRILEAKTESQGELDLTWLRRLCLHRGIELPYRGATSKNRPAGLAAALRLAATVRAARVVLVSDLDGIAGDLGVLGHAAAACRRRGHSLVNLFPVARRYLPADLLARPSAARAAEIFSWEVGRREQELQAALSRLGFHVISMGPEDDLAQILGSGKGRTYLCRRSSSSVQERPAQKSHVW